MSGYIDLRYKPDLKKEVLATFYVEPDVTFEEAAEAIAEESSIGSWTEIATLKAKIKNKLKATVYYLNEKDGIVKLAYPLDLFELGSIPQLLSSIGGNIFSMKAIKNLRLEDLEFPEKYIKSFQGPAVGLSGIRKLFRVKNRILLGSIIKPKVGLNPTEQADLSYEVWRNGIDIIKDDENLTSMTFNNFEERVQKVLKKLKKVEDETGKVKVYAANVTAPPDVMLERAKFVKKQGGRCVMVDIISVGYDNVQYLRKQNLGLIIHGHRAGHSTFTRNPRHGISMLVVAKLARLAGIDQLHTGTVVGKMEGSKEETISVNELLQEDFSGFNKLREDWSRIKPSMPIASGGMHPGLMGKLIEILGTNLIVNFGAGIHGHREGSAAGARACLQAAEAIEKGISLEGYAKNHEELNIALSQWSGIKYKIQR